MHTWSYMHTCIHAYIMHSCIHASMHPCIHTCIHTYLHTYIPTYLHTYIPTCLHHTHIPTYLHIYIPTYLHTYIPTYPHTYVHTYIQTDRQVLCVWCNYAFTLRLFICIDTIGGLISWFTPALYLAFPKVLQPCAGPCVVGGWRQQFSRIWELTGRLSRL